MIETNNPYRYRYGFDYYAKWTVPTWFSLGSYETSPYVYNFTRTVGNAESGSLLTKFVLIDYPTDATITNVRNRQFSRLTSMGAVANNYNAFLDGLDADGIDYNNVSGAISRVVLGGGNTYQGTFHARKIEWNDGLIPVFLSYNGSHHLGAIEDESDANSLRNPITSNKPDWKLSFMVKKGVEGRLFTPKYHGYAYHGTTNYNSATYSTIFLQPGTYEITKIYDVLKETTRDFRWQKWIRKTNKKTLVVDQTNGAYYLDFVDAETEVYENWIYSD